MNRATPHGVKKPAAVLPQGLTKATNEVVHSSLAHGVLPPTRALAEPGIGVRHGAFIGRLPADGTACPNTVELTPRCIRTRAH